MKLLKNSILTQSFTTFTIILIVFLFLQGVFGILFINNLAKQEEQTIELLKENATVQADTIVETTKNITTSFSLSTITRNLIYPDTYNNKTLAVDSFQASVQNIIYSNPYIDDIVLVTNTGEKYNTDSSSLNFSNDNTYKSEQYNNLTEDNYFSYFSSDNTLVLIRKIYSRTEESTWYFSVGYIYFVIDFEEAFQNVTDNSTILSENVLIAASDTYGTEYNYGYTSLQGDLGKSFSTKIFNDSIDINISYGEYFSSINTLYVFWITTNTVLLIFSITLIFALLMIKIKNPLYSLLSQLKSIEELNKNQRLEVNGGAEINYLAQTINTLLDSTRVSTKKIIETQAKLYELEIENKESNFYALQSQINPHFLYNTLQCIRGITLIHNVPEIADICTDIAKIFRYSIKGENLVSLSNELEILENYIHIMQIRFDNRYKITTCIPNEMLNTKISKLTFQPILENSFNYGLFNTYNDGFIKIIGKRKNGHNVFYIVDNGEEVDQQNIRAINKKIQLEKTLPIRGKNAASIGLINVYQRLSALFEDDVSVLITRRFNTTIVKITVPNEIFKNK